MSDLHALFEPDAKPIQGFVRQAAARGLDPYAKVDLISHIHENLWSGGCIGGAPLPEDFTHVFSLYPWERYKLGPNTKLHETKLYDELDQNLDAVDALADEIVAALDEEDSKVLIHCQAGLNRSGLLTGLVLCKLGFEAKEALDLLRSQRSPLVLCNEAFEHHLLTHQEVY